MSDVYAFACRVDGAAWGETTINALSRGEAKVRYWRDVSESWENVKYTDVRARKVGPAHTSERFLHNARYRGMPDVRCGDEVTVGKHQGVIVGHNSSANFDVLFTTGPWTSNTLNVHPSEVTRTPRGKTP